ncbi:MAG: glycosyltransferase [Oscillatoriales cyanobacterium SM2_2_1]|nr:glycosyltransferase [Oscillatoriales cyanobacterium SM2_2_1]
MRIIHLFDHLNQGNMGILKTTSALSVALKEAYDIPSELWFPRGKAEIAPQARGLDLVPLEHTDLGFLNAILSRQAIIPHTTTVMTHGCWQHPTLWGQALKKRGCYWIYTPHGMLEPWSRQQKWLKKWLYFRVIEQIQAANADIIRAVSRPEHLNLQKKFPQTTVTLIPYGLKSDPTLDRAWAETLDQPRICTILFMARLHPKKGIMPLIEGWCRSILYQNPGYELAIAGFDDGALPYLTQTLNALSNANIRYLGPVFGQEKAQVLAQSRYYILPSHSEGLPTSVLEAMQCGLIPLISDGCNLPEAIDAGIALRCNPNPEAIAQVLNSLPSLSPHEQQHRRLAAQNFVETHFAVEKTAARLMRLIPCLQS